MTPLTNAIRILPSSEDTDSFRQRLMSQAEYEEGIYPEEISENKNMRNRIPMRDTLIQRRKLGRPSLLLAGFIGAIGVVAWILLRRSESASFNLVSGTHTLDSLESNEKKPSFGEGTRDKVDEASWESFPASDPPAW